MLPCPFSSPILSTKFLRDIIREHVKNGQTKDKCSCKEGIGVKRDTFSSFHPIVGLLFFVLVLGFTMFFMHPVCLGISLVCALAYSARLEGGRTLVGQMRYMLPLLLFTALLNPLFNHQGATVLFQLPNGSSITLEAVAYGGAAAGMLLAVVVWFRCFGAVITSDKFLYLFGQDLAVPVPPAVHGLSVCAPVPHPYAGRVPGSAGRRGSPKAPGGASRLFRHRHLGPGERHGNR